MLVKINTLQSNSDRQHNIQCRCDPKNINMDLWKSCSRIMSMSTSSQTSTYATKLLYMSPDGHLEE